MLSLPVFFVSLHRETLNLNIMSKIVVKSKRQINMSHSEYMQVHRRMFAIVHDDSFRIGLYVSLTQTDIYVEVTEPAFHAFLDYEMDFGTMLNIFATLCIKYGSFPCPF